MNIDHLEVKIIIQNSILDAKARFENEKDEKNISYYKGVLDAYRNVLSSLELHVENKKGKV